MVARDTVEILDTLFAAIERADLETVGALYAEGVEVWHNVTGEALDKAGSLDLLGYWCHKVTGIRYEVLERRTYDGGAFQRHIVHGDADGAVIAAEICIVFHVRDGNITRIFEYLDPAAVAAVFGATR